MSTKKPWEHAKSGGSETDDLATRFVESLSIDTRLYRHDIAGSVAHARMLRHVGLITKKELKAIEKGLAEIEAQIDQQGDDWPGWRVELEDVHMCIEAALIEKIGEPGKKLHTGRSRNDQVATDLLLWSRQATSEVAQALIEVLRRFVELAQRQGGIVMPSYTHLQRAQPILLGGELLAWVEALGSCVDRLAGLPVGWRCPLGSGAIAGSSLPLDRKHTADALLPGGATNEMIDAFQEIFGLDDQALDDVDIATSVSRNAIHATASRDVALDLLYALAMIAMWLSRWAEQWILYMTGEFGFLDIGQAYTTGSSMMPQKRNPDMLELIRGRCGGVYGHLVAMLTICKGLPIGYNRDLQEDKRHLFDAYDTVMDCLAITAQMVRSARFNEDRIAGSLDRGYLDATALAEYLVTKGVPFRTAHQHVGTLVQYCIENDVVQLADLSVEQMKRIAGCDAIDDKVHQWLGAANVVEHYQSYGNAGRSGFEKQLADWEERLGMA